MKHGTIYAYSKRGCRCDECRAAVSSYRKRLRADMAAQCVLIDGRWTHPQAPHGKYSSYTNYCCRCEACTEAWRVDHARYVAKTQEASA